MQTHEILNERESVERTGDDCSDDRNVETEERRV